MKKQFSGAGTGLLLAMILVLMASATSFAQGRGHAYGRRHGRGGVNLDWKCGKFVNCHDARDGRIDGRGPRRRAGLWQNRSFDPRGTRVGNRHYNTNDYWRRRHLTDRRGVREFERDEVLRERRENRIDRFENRGDRFENRGITRHGRGRP